MGIEVPALEGRSPATDVAAAQTEREGFPVDAEEQCSTELITVVAIREGVRVIERSGGLEVTSDARRADP
jgi:hypothetical protein